MLDQMNLRVEELLSVLASAASLSPISMTKQTTAKVQYEIIREAFQSPKLLTFPQCRTFALRSFGLL